MTNLPISELQDSELDAVAGGVAVATGGLAGIAVDIDQVNVLRGVFVDIDVDVDDTLNDIANNNKIGVGVLANVLGGPALLLQRG